MGYAHLGICYGTQQEAVDVFFEGIPQSIVQSGTDTIVTGYTRDINGGWFLTKGTHAANGTYTQAYTVSVLAPNFATCDDPTSPSAAFADGIELGWGVAVVLVAAWCIWVLRRGL